jgi:outer membrane biosynthesis protein TonB
LPEIERTERETLPPQLARIVLERQQVPQVAPKAEPPSAKPVEQQKKPIPKPEPEHVRPVQAKPQAKAAPQPAAKAKVTPRVMPDDAAKVVQARAKAAVSGLLQFKDDLAAMRDDIDVAKLAAGAHGRGQATASEIDRSVLAGRTINKSGGIQVAALSRDTGGAALLGRENTQVSSALATPVAKTQSTNGGGGHAATGRSDQDIRRIMDSNKGAIFSIYNRALRKNPALAGKMTVQLVIEPSGKVSAIKVITNELSDPELEKKLMARIRMIDFGAKSVATTTLKYSFDFLPY